MKIHICPSHQIEVGCQRHSRPSYRWVCGWEQVQPTGPIPPGAGTIMTLSSWRAVANRGGDQLVVHRTAEEARAAAISDVK